MSGNSLEYDSAVSIPNKLLHSNGSVTTIQGYSAANPVLAYNAKKAIPNKFLNPDGTYSTLEEILSVIVDTDLFIIVDELPTVGKTSKIYLLKADGNKFIEYIFVNSAWEPIGMVEFDLSQYSTTAQMNAAILAALATAQEYSDSNFLSKTNTTTYTPSADYHPATKKYVDDNAISFKPFPEEFITNQSTETFFRSVMEVDPPTGMVYLGGVTFTDMPEGLVNSEVELYVYPGCVYYAVMRSADISPYEWSCVNIRYRGWEGIDKTAKDYVNQNFLKIDNSEEYVPTGDYNPATKKYVDTATSGIPIGVKETSIADTYLAVRTYYAGDYVTYEHELYECTTDITTAEPWTAAHWRKTNTINAISAKVTGALERSY